jgi:hypothetical protein
LIQAYAPRLACPAPALTGACASAGPSTSYATNSAPYVGYAWSRKFGNTADYAEATGEEADGHDWVTGFRFWF